MGLLNLICRKSKNDGNSKGKRYERKVAKKLKRSGIGVLHINKQIYQKNRRITDIDIETKYANIEVKIGGKSNKIGRQLRLYKKISPKEPIGMAPNLNNTERKKLYEDGFNVFAKEVNLVKYLKYKDRNQGKKNIIYDPKKVSKKKRR